MGRLKECGSYPDKPFKALATALWNELFKVIDESIDIVHCRINADSASIKLSVRNSRIDQADPDAGQIKLAEALVDGIIELLDGEPSAAAQDTIREEFRAWVELGILKAFQSARVAKKFEKFNPDKKEFAIITSTIGFDLDEADISFIWSNRPRLTVAQIKSRQAAARKKRKASGKRRGQVLRKKKGVTKKKATTKKKPAKKKKSGTKKKVATKKKSASKSKGKSKKKPTKKKATNNRAPRKKTAKKKTSRVTKRASKKR